jgi:hypothetical protein
VKYQRELVRLLRFLLLSSDDDFISSELRTSLRVYKETWAADDLEFEAQDDVISNSNSFVSEDTFDSLQDCLYDMVRSRTYDDATCNTIIPAYRFLVHAAIRDDLVYESADYLTHLMAMLLYAFRGILLLQSVQEKKWTRIGDHPSFMHLYDIAGNKSRDSNTEGLSTIQAYLQAIGTVTTHGSEYSVLPSFSFSSGGSRIELNNIDITADQLRMTIKTVLDEANADLLCLLLDFNADGFIPSKTLDDETDRGAFKSFLDYNLQLKESGLKEFVNRCIKIGLLSFDSQVDLVGLGDARRVEAYLGKIESFLEKLLFLIHTTCGQPGRGTEICYLQYSNSPASRRHLYVHNGELIISPTYNKTDSRTQKARVIIRHLDSKIRSLVISFLAFIRPVEM